MKNYSVREPIPRAIQEKLEVYSPFTQELLYFRGIEDQNSAEEFLNPKYENLADPYLLKDMDKAVKRILKAIKKKEKVAIFSDYDADGIPGAVILHDFFKKIGFKNFINYIPLRNEEGFGLNKEAIEKIAKEGVKLIVTIDCGITDVDQVDLANELDMETIITDHHTPLEKLPKAYAIINPKQKGDKYPEKMLCGSGVIFRLIVALINSGGVSFPKGQEKWLLDMVGLATLSDMVPLLGENRILSYFGMKVLQKTPRVGLMKLFSLLNINQQTLTEDDLTFMVTPRINAASRMGVPHDAFLLLSTTNEVEAGEMAIHLNNKNEERKGLVGSMVREIKQKIKNKEDMKDVLVFGDPAWKPSLLGLVASSFSEEHARPVFFWGRNGDEDGLIKGSCRGDGVVDVVSIMDKVKDLFVEYGGHKGAGGFSMKQENIHELEDRLNKAFRELVKDEKKEDVIFIDKKITLDDVNEKTWNEVERFAPFGFDNPKPLFLLENIETSGVKMFGKAKDHLELKFKNSRGEDVTAISFFTTAEKFRVSLEVGNKINMIATMEKSTFRNTPEIRLRIVDVY